MFQFGRCNSRNLLLGFLVFAVAFFVCWQLVGLTHPNNSTKTGNLIHSQPAEIVTNLKQTSVQSSSCNKTIGAENVATSNDAFQWCSADSSARGMHQKVITFTLFGAANMSLFSRYDSLLRNISTTSRQMYPGWIVRIYHNFHNESETERSIVNQLFDLSCQFDHVDLCSIAELIARIPALTPIDPALIKGLNPRMLRFLVMLDPNVDIFISRDTDSVIWRREVDAVNEWLRSNYTFHLMRDHKNHTAIILAGMWGAKLHQRRDLIQGLTRALILGGQDTNKNTDQNLLEKIVWPTVQYDVMAHDSYHCEYKGLLNKSPLKMYPFPTERNGSSFVGGVGLKLEPSKCPEACRPPDHKEWQYC
uniref:Lactosylceramide n=1 Tax=Daphnia magna TaxID=35525 RepID=A0A0P5A3Z5_9CRUS